MLINLSLFCLLSFSLFAEEHVYLKTPDLSSENRIGTNVGVRPFRKSGIRLEVEAIKEKLILHNYGYGGSGLTLCFGGASEVINLLEHQAPASKFVAVLGAGAVGLATAYELLEQGYEVHLYSDDWIPNLTSNVAAGMWSPYHSKKEISEETKALFERLLATSEARFLKSTTDSPEFDGVKFISSYSFKSKETPDIILPKNEGEEVIVHFDNGHVKKGVRFVELGIDGKLFLEDLFGKVKLKGAELKQFHFESLEDVLSLEEPIIVNCTSMGSIKLFNDQDFTPVRGQIIYYKHQESFDYVLYHNVPTSSSDYYFVSIYPWSDRIILNGVYEWGKEERVLNPAAIEKIIENGERCLTGDL